MLVNTVCVGKKTNRGNTSAATPPCLTNFKYLFKRFISSGKLSHTITHGWASSFAPMVYCLFLFWVNLGAVFIGSFLSLHLITPPPQWPLTRLETDSNLASNIDGYRLRLVSRPVLSQWSKTLYHQLTTEAGKLPCRLFCACASWLSVSIQQIKG